MTTLIGIDVGLTGGVASIAGDRVSVHDMPTLADGKSRRIDGRALILLLRQLLVQGEPHLFVIEDIRPRPAGNAGAHGNTLHSQGSLMRSRGVIEGVTDIMGGELRAVQPQSWKRFFGLLRTEKSASLEKARALYPSVSRALARQKDQNRAESLLIAHYGLKKLA